MILGNTVQCTFILHIHIYAVRRFIDKRLGVSNILE